MKRITHILNSKPLAFLSIVFALRDLLVGLALVLGSAYDNTVLAHNLDQIGGRGLYGSILAAIAVATVASVFVHFPKYTRWFLTASGWFWLFTAMSYAASGHYVFAGVYVLMCSLPALYIAYYYRSLPRGES